MKRSMLFGLLLAASSLLQGEETREPESGTIGRWATVDGVMVHYRDRGAVPGSNAAPMLLIHGWLGSSYDFQALIDELPRNRRIIAPDLPGCGLSQKTGIDFTPDYYRSFLEHLLRTLDVSRVILVGHSMGGGIAVSFAARNPRLVERVVLIDPDGLRGEEGPLGVIRRLGLIVDLGMALNNRLAIGFANRVNVFSDPSRVTREYLDSMALTCLTPQGRRAQAQITKQVLGCSPVDELLPKLSVPSLVLWGEGDRILSPRWATRYVEMIPDARLVMIPSSGHMPQIEAPRLVADAILRFVGATGAGGSGRPPQP